MTQQLRKAFDVALVAALAASVGDLLLLYAGNAQRPELGIASPPSAVVWLGAVLGVLAIPLYSVGYWAASRPFAATSPGSARTVVASGSIASVLGAVIHALTAFAIDAGRRVGATAAPPLDAVAHSGAALVSLWLIVGVAFLVASSTYAWRQWRSGTERARVMACINPVVVTLALAAIAAPSEMLRSFLVPAAPNVAHVVFFFALRRATPP